MASQCCDAFPEGEQRGVDVSGLLQTLPERLGFVAPLGAGEVTQREPDGPPGGELRAGQLEEQDGPPGGELRAGQLEDPYPAPGLNPPTDAYSLRYSLDISSINSQKFHGKNTVAEDEKQNRKLN